MKPVRLKFCYTEIFVLLCQASLGLKIYLRQCGLFQANINNIEKNALD
jgi:hypothetical protein